MDMVLLCLAPYVTYWWDRLQFQDPFINLLQFINIAASFIYSLPQAVVIIHEVKKTTFKLTTGFYSASNKIGFLA